MRMDAFRWFFTLAEAVIMLFVAYLFIKKIKRYEPETYQKNLKNGTLILGILLLGFVMINLYFFWL